MNGMFRDWFGPTIPVMAMLLPPLSIDVRTDNKIVVAATEVGSIRGTGSTYPPPPVWQQHRYHHHHHHDQLAMILAIAVNC
jgi:hypothetical protein